ncbi:YueI family protein [Bacillus timonensis]|nr:YueI family protein [Bacillus timonensis]
MKNKPDVDTYLQNGIYGNKQIKPEERNIYLGSLRERVVVALTQSQVMEPGTYDEVEELIMNNPNATLYLNGNMAYSYLSDYIKLANKNKNHFTTVTNKKYNSELGLVLAYDHAIEKEEIFINKETHNSYREKEQEENFFTKLIKNIFFSSPHS